MKNCKLDDFKKAQERDYSQALKEIQSGHKRSHWMWYIFPQIDGLGRSETARYYAIKNIAEAKDYLRDPVLGKHLIEISQALLALKTDDPTAVMGYPDDLKLRSSMTLFEAADPENPVFSQVLDKFYGGRRDEQTLAILRAAGDD